MDGLRVGDVRLEHALLRAVVAAEVAEAALPALLAVPLVRGGRPSELLAPVLEDQAVLVQLERLDLADGYPAARSSRSASSSTAGPISSTLYWSSHQPEHRVRRPEADRVVDDRRPSHAASLGDGDPARDGELEPGVLEEHGYHLLLPLGEVLARVVASLLEQDDAVAPARPSPRRLSPRPRPSPRCRRRRSPSTEPLGVLPLDYQSAPAVAAEVPGCTKAAGSGPSDRCSRRSSRPAASCSSRTTS